MVIGECEIGIERAKFSPNFARRTSQRCGGPASARNQILRTGGFPMTWGFKGWSDDEYPVLLRRPAVIRPVLKSLDHRAFKRSAGVPPARWAGGARQTPGASGWKNRFTRQTNAFSRKIRNHAALVAIHAVHYNLARIRKTPRITSAMAAGLSDHVWSLEEIIPIGGQVCAAT